MPRHKEIVIPPMIPQGSKGDTLEGCAHRDIIGKRIGTGKGALEHTL